MLYHYNKTNDRQRKAKWVWVMRHAICAAQSSSAIAKDHYSAIFDSTALMFLYHSLWYIFEMVRESRFRNSAGLQWWRGRKAMRRSVQWGEDMLSSPGKAQGCWRRRIWDKTRCLEGWGPIQQGKGKKGRVTPGEGGGGGKLRIHRFVLNQTKSKFLGVHVAMQLSKWAGNLRGRDSEDTHGHLHFKRVVSKCSITYVQDGQASCCFVAWKEMMWALVN